MKYTRHDLKDKNHNEIVGHLRSLGIYVVETQRPVDTLLFNGQEAGWMEIKVPGWKGYTKRGQLQFIADTVMPVAIATTKEEAAAFAFNMKNRAITNHQQAAILKFLAKYPDKQFTGVQVQALLNGGEVTRRKV